MLIYLDFTSSTNPNDEMNWVPRRKKNPLNNTMPHLVPNQITAQYTSIAPFASSYHSSVQL